MRGEVHLVSAHSRSYAIGLAGAWMQIACCHWKIQISMKRFSETNLQHAGHFGNFPFRIWGEVFSNGHLIAVLRLGFLSV